MTDDERRREALKRKRARERVVPEEEMQPKHRKSNLKQARKAAKKAEKKEARKTKRKKITAFHVVSGLLGIAIFVLSFLLLFHIQTIKVTGNEYTSSKEVIAWLQPDALSKNAMYVWVKNKVMPDEILQTTSKMEVKLEAPWSVKVVLTEKPVVAGTIIGNDYVYVDQDGVVMKKGTDILDKVPLVEGISADKATLYKKLSVEDTKVFEHILEVSQYLAQNELVPDKLECGENSSINLTFGGVVVTLGTGNYEVKISQIPPILKKLDSKTGTLDLQSYDGTQGTISFKNG